MPLKTQTPFILCAHQRHRRGQTAVVALLVLLLLAFIGALFITIIARNLQSQARSHRTLSADYYAEAGLRFADDQLTHSLDGADWRPPLQDTLASPPTDARGLARYNAIKGTLTDYTVAPNSSDPDVAYLKQGFTRYDTENGRFLLRVTYDPITLSTTNTPNARYVKIESIGREGVVQADDPTTYSSQPASQLVATQVAYKPIGITDYARFETNIDNRSDTANLGVPSSVDSGGNIVTPGVFDFNLNNGGSQPLQQYPLTTVYGQSDAYLLRNGTTTIYPNPTAGTGANAPSNYTLVAGGGSIRANMPLRFYGMNTTYLNRDTTTTALDAVEVAGNLLLNDYVPNGSAANTTTMNFGPGSGEPSALAVLATTAAATGTQTTTYAAPSNAAYGTSANPTKAPFDTDTGAIRDGGTGSNSSDPEGNPRSIARLDPPVIDSVSSATNLTRYQDITENSPPRFMPGTTTPYPAAPYNDGTKVTVDGYGQAIYINNTADIQRDSNSLVGGHTLVDEWLNRNSGGQSSITAKSGWQGPFYNPPGVDVTFGPQTANLNGSISQFYGVRMTRSDVDASGGAVGWKDPTDPTHKATLGPTMLVSYADLNATNNPASDPATLTGAARAEYYANPNNDVVIYAEGNVRVRPSVISDPAGNPVHITLITNGTAYIEGSVLKGNADSSITILAKDYVCLNTTQFYAGAIADEDAQSAQMPRASVSGSDLLDFAADSDVLVQDFDFTPPANSTAVALYVSGGPSATGAAAAQFDFVNPVTGASVTGNGQPFAAPPISALFDSGVGAGIIGAPGAGAGASGLTHITFDLTNTGLPNGPLQLWTRRGPGQDQLNGNPNVSTVLQDYVQERSAILPGDVKIQAVLYAQDKSFFVIPGPWFNSDAGDNLQSFVDSPASATSPPTRPGIVVSTANAGRFPFYGQPADLKITIDGTVSEARPADISAQAAWMQKWGWIPQYHGSNLGTRGTTAQPEPAGHVNPTAANTPAVGLTLVYDPLAGYPFDVNSATGASYYLRSDAYGRPLPFTPKLPVSTGLLYSGQGDPQAAL